MSERSTDVDETPSNRTWSGQVGLSYRFTDRLSLSAGPSFSYSEIDDAADVYSESYSAQLNWRPTDKLRVNFSAGAQNTHSTSSTGRGFSDPVMNLSVGYSPFQTTSINVGVSRTVTPSLLQDRVNDTYRWTANLQQRLLGKFYLNLSYGRHDSDYLATNSLVTFERHDLVESYGASLSTRLVRRLTISANIQENKNTSNLAEFSFSSTQYGLQLSWEF